MNAERLPERLFRVHFWAAIGWPYPDDRERKRRTFDTAIAAAKQVRIIQGMPSHLQLVGVYRGDVVWSEIDVDQLPEVEQVAS